MYSFSMEQQFTTQWQRELLTFERSSLFPLTPLPDEFTETIVTEYIRINKKRQTIGSHPLMWILLIWLPLSSISALICFYVPYWLGYVYTFQKAILLILDPSVLYIKTTMYMVNWIMASFTVMLGIFMTGAVLIMAIKLIFYITKFPFDQVLDIAHSMQKRMTTPLLFFFIRFPATFFSIALAWPLIPIHCFRYFQMEQAFSYKKSLSSVPWRRPKNHWIQKYHPSFLQPISNRHPLLRYLRFTATQPLPFIPFIPQNKFTLLPFLWVSFWMVSLLS